MISTFFNIFKVPELRKKILFTLMLLAIYRVGFHIPLPGVNQEAMAKIFGGDSGDNPLQQAANYLSMFTGGMLTQSSLFGLGIMPYISASIIFQLLATVLPALERLAKEGASGRKKIQEYTRYAAVGLCLVQSSFIMVWLKRSGFVYPEIAIENNLMFTIMGIAGMTAGTVFLMWLGEQIDEYGIGNGISLIIMAGILSRFPWAIGQLIKDVRNDVIGVEKVPVLILAFVAVIAGAIMITQGQRRIPIQQARMTRGRKVYGGQRQYLPLRVNQGGVIPIIFAVTLMQMPRVLFSQLSKAFDVQIWRTLENCFSQQSFTYNICYISLIFFFAFFWTTVQFQPKEIANNLRDQGAFIPGLRPGRRTAEYLEKVVTRITYAGAGFLALIAVVPTLIIVGLDVNFMIANFLGGTGLLIVVSVSLDLVQRVETNLMMRNYSGFMDTGKIKGAR